MNSDFFRLSRAFVVAGVCLASSLAAAQIANGSFESGGGTFAGWAVAGDTLVLDNTLGSGPTDGTWQAFLATATDGTVNNNVPAGSGTTPGNLEALLQVSAGTLAGVGNGTPILGSALAQTVSMNAGDRVLFDWDFLTNQTFNDGTTNSVAPSTTNNDFSFFTAAPVGSPGLGSLAVLADTFYGYVNNPSAPGGFETGFTITAGSNPFISETGFHTFSWTAPSTGMFVIGAGVVHASNFPDNGVNSALLVDNFALEPVPEPASLAALATLASGLVLRRRRRTV